MAAYLQIQIKHTHIHCVGTTYNILILNSTEHKVTTCL